MFSRLENFTPEVAETGAALRDDNVRYVFFLGGTRHQRRSLEPRFGYSLVEESNEKRLFLLRTVECADRVTSLDIKRVGHIVRSLAT